MKQYYNDTYSFHIHLQDSLVSGKKKMNLLRLGERSSPIAKKQLNWTVEDRLKLKGLKNKLNGKGKTSVYILYPIKISDFGLYYNV